MKVSQRNHLFGAFLIIVIIAVLCLRISVEATHYRSPDSDFYIRVAANILEGKGLRGPNTFPFDENTPEQHFAAWAPGYPILTAFLAWLTGGVSVFWASKMVNFIALVAIYILLFKWVGSRAWFPFLYFCSFAMLEVYSYSWSEPIFLVFVLLLAYQLKNAWYERERFFFLKLTVTLALLFFIRYAGLVYYFGVAFYAIAAFFMGRRKLSFQCIISLAICSMLALGYFYYNYLQVGDYTGGERVFPDWINNLDFIGNLFHGLLNSASLARNFYLATDEYLYFALMLIQLAVIGYMITKRKLINGPLFKNNEDVYALWATSFSYMLILLILRRLSPFDPFDYRILSPFILPFFVGLFMAILKQEAFFQKVYRPIVAFMMLCLVMNLPKVYLFEKVKALLSMIL